MMDNGSYRTTYTNMDQLIPAMYDQWSDPEINFDDIVNESFYRSNDRGGGGGNGTQQLNEFNTCSITTRNKFTYNANEDNENDDEITLTAENTSFNYNNLSASASYGLIPYFDEVQQNSMVTSFTSKMVWHSKDADSKVYHGKGGSGGGSTKSRTSSGGSSHLSGDAIPFVPIAQSKASKFTFPFHFILDNLSFGFFFARPQYSHKREIIRT